ncbi:cystatin family protein [Pseudomonas wadenswilerensis]
MSSLENIPGGWSSLHEPDAKELAIFKEATPQLGVDYKVLQVRTQVVNGTNYRFVADQTVPGHTHVRRVSVDIYAPINGKPVLVGIEPLLG